jgi:hypothetical protein
MIGVHRVALAPHCGSNSRPTFNRVDRRNIISEPNAGSPYDRFYGGSIPPQGADATGSELFYSLWFAGCVPLVALGGCGCASIHAVAFASIVPGASSDRADTDDQ